MSNAEFWTIIIMNISILILVIRIRWLEKDLLQLEKDFSSHLISHFLKEYNNDRNTD